MLKDKNLLIGILLVILIYFIQDYFAKENLRKETANVRDYLLINHLPIEPSKPDVSNISQWRVCHSDSECVIVGEPCFTIPVNSKFSAKASYYYGQMSATLDCKLKKTSKVQCIKNLCQIMDNQT
jgi:hypothetical protein